MDLKHFEKDIIPKIEAGRSIEAVRHIIKTGQYAEQDRRESLKETYKPITDELKKVDEGIDELKDELAKDIKAITGIPALSSIKGPVPASLEGPSQSEVTIDDYMTKEEQKSVMEREYPNFIELVNNPDLKEKTLKRLAKESKSLGGKKRSAKVKQRLK